MRSIFRQNAWYLNMVRNASIGAGAQGGYFMPVFCSKDC